MKRYIYATSVGFIILGTAVIQTTFASTTTTFDTESFSDITLSSESDGRYHTGSQRWPMMRGGQTGTGDIIPLPQLELTDDELTAFAAMSDDERIAFLSAKGITPKSGTGNMDNRVRRSTPVNSWATVDTTPQKQDTTVSKIATLARAQRIAENKAKQLELRKERVQKKIAAGERLTQLDKKFADANDIDYSM